MNFSIEAQTIIDRMLTRGLDQGILKNSLTHYPSDYLLYQDSPTWSPTLNMARLDKISVAIGNERS